MREAPGVLGGRASGRAPQVHRKQQQGRAGGGVEGSGGQHDLRVRDVHFDE